MADDNIIFRAGTDFSGDAALMSVRLVDESGDYTGDPLSVTELGTTGVFRATMEGPPGVYGAFLFYVDEPLDNTPAFVWDGTNILYPLTADQAESAAAAAIAAAGLSTFDGDLSPVTDAIAIDVATALGDYEVATAGDVLAAQTAILAGGFLATDRTALLAIAYGRQRIDFATSTFTLFDATTGDPVQVFDLQTAEGDPAISADTAVDRVPQPVPEP